MGLDVKFLWYWPWITRDPMVKMPLGETYILIYFDGVWSNDRFGFRMGM